MDAAYRLEDRYERPEGRVHLNGNQALVRALLDRSRLDAAAGSRTAGFVSGYRGSPLGVLDDELTRSRAYLEDARIHFSPGVNEDLAATAVWGSQQVGLLPEPRYDGVFALWYGKGPGVDRSSDALKHGNYAGVGRNGGVLVVAGDDPAAKSSSLAHQSEPALIAAGIPILAPADLQDYVDFAVVGWELSRYSGCWVGFKVVTEVLDSSGTINVGSVPYETRSFASQPVSTIELSRPALMMEQDLWDRRLPAAQTFVRAAGLDRIYHHEGRRLGIISAGRTYLELREALDVLGIDEAEFEKLGLRLYKPALTWPLEPEGIREFVSGLTDVLVLEEKQPLIEQQLARICYELADRPRLAGKRFFDGTPLIPTSGELSAATIRPALTRWLSAVVADWRAPAEASLSILPPRAVPEAKLAPITRRPAFCSGCPHNTSTVIPDGSLAMGGIGCHGMVIAMPERDTPSLTHMGGEGATWIGQSPFTETPHIFQNVGDGTYFHSGMLAIRAAVAAGVNITYKVLANGAIAMTGGQRIEGEPFEGTVLVPDIVAQLKALGVGSVVVVNDGTHGYADGAIPPDVPIRPREQMDTVQRELRELPGVTAIVYDQACSTELRRLRKRDKIETPPERVVINELVCEGCGDCNVQSNCIAVEPVDTRFGRKRKINQESCNIDLSCLKGYCPSFVVVTGGTPVKAARDKAREIDELAKQLPDPVPSGGQSLDLIIAGIGGTGVTTVAAIIGMAAHLSGAEVDVLNQTGLAQKNGPVTSHIRVRPPGDDLYARRVQPDHADVVLGADLLTAVSAAVLPTIAPDRTEAFLNMDVAPTSDLAGDRDLDVDVAALISEIESRARRVSAFDVTRAASELLGVALAVNMVLVGCAVQRGLLPFSAEELDRAVELNGSSVDPNRRALSLGRLLVAKPQAIAELLAPTHEPVDESLEVMIAERSRFLTEYQDARYARRFQKLVQKTRSAVTGAGMSADDELIRVVAASYFKLLAYKDEYEVARLYADGSFRRQLEREFTGGKLAIQLAPQLFFSKDSRTGRVRKVSVPGSIAFPAFSALAKLKRLRGTRLDPFGWSAHRQEERSLITWYESLIDEVLSVVSDHYEVALELAALPHEIRGYGVVKDEAIKFVRNQELVLRARMNEQRNAPTLVSS